MSENTQSYSAKGEVSNITKRRTRFERIKIAFSKAPLSAWFGRPIGTLSHQGRSVTNRCGFG